MSSISSKKQTKTRRIVVKTNSFVRFLEEFMAWQFAFEINCPLVTKILRLLNSCVYFFVVRGNPKNEEARLSFYSNCDDNKKVNNEL